MQDNQNNQASNTPWQFNANATQQSTSSETPQSVKWSASEFIAYHKPAGWYFMIFIAMATVAALAYFLTRDYLSSGAIVIAGMLFLIFSARQPRVLTYEVDSKGVSIGNKRYMYKDFRSFSVIEETRIRSIMLSPLKRFMPAISMYFAPEDEKNIVDALSNYLPYEDRKQDAIDKAMQRLRF